MDRPEHHSFDRQKERGVEKGSGQHSTLHGREWSVFNLTNIGTVSRATLGRLLRDGVEQVWAFLSATMPSWAETETKPRLYTKHDRLVGLVVRCPPWERKILGSNPAYAMIFSGSSHTSDLKIGTPVATLPGAWRYRVSAGTGRPGVSILWLGEMESLICNFYFSVAARKFEQIRPRDTLACCWDVKQPTNNIHKTQQLITWILTSVCLRRPDHPMTDPTSRGIWYSLAPVP